MYNFLKTISKNNLVVNNFLKQISKKQKTNLVVNN